MEYGNQKPKKSLGWLWALLGCLGGIILIVIIIILVVMLFFKGVDEEINGTQEEQETTKKIAGKTFNVGDTVKVDGIEVTLVSVEEVRANGELETPPENGKALKVNFKFKNNNENQILMKIKY